MATAMPAPTPDDDDDVSLNRLIESVFEPGKPSHEVALLAYEAASEGERRAAALEGLKDSVLQFARRWNKRKPRSGHTNASGRLRALPSMPGGILAEEIRTNSGAVHLVGEVTLAITADLIADYGLRAKASMAGYNFWKAVRTEMSKAKVAKLAELGEERVEKLREKHGYRV